MAGLYNAKPSQRLQTNERPGLDEVVAMLACHLLMSVTVSVSVAVMSLSQGHSGLHSLGVGIIGSVVGLVGSAALAWGLRWRSSDQISLQDDPLTGHSMVRAAVEQSPQSTSPHVVRHPTDAP